MIRNVGAGGKKIGNKRLVSKTVTNWNRTCTGDVMNATVCNLVEVH
jgi:hypothetical protein